ncbi:MAG: phospholipase D family protein [Candidatus Sumerlaeia bacterium]|nr:phospholipase D family protein [Candidatus Sumerlaeia bacterium]
MTKFLNTSATTYHLEELIKSATERLILISPFLKFNERIRELLEDRNRLKIDIRIIYGKSELLPDEIAWLKSLEYVRLSFCKNLHAKCYLNEKQLIISSMNLYEFSQVNNNEMGVLVSRYDDTALYNEAYQESQRLIRISEEVKLSVERVSPLEPVPTTASSSAPTSESAVQETDKSASGEKKVSTSQMAKNRNIQPKELFSKLQSMEYIRREGDAWVLAPKGEKAGGEIRKSKMYGDYIIWPEDLKV